MVKASIRWTLLLSSCGALIAAASGCGGSSVGSRDDDAGRAGMSGSGASGGSGGTTGGTAGGGMGGTSGKGGNAGTGGVSGAAGSAGTAGGGECVTGGACADEGTSCSLGGCCACSLRCTDGTWGQALCPPCAAAVCPLSVPEEGSACDECTTLSPCEWDQRPMDGSLYVGTCENGQWHVQVKGEMPVCCTSDEQCAPLICVNTRCAWTSPDSCWRDDECEGGQICSGASICPCDADCKGVVSVTGKCVPADQGCCATDQDCDEEATCVAGVCKSNPGDLCWNDRDCNTSVAEVCAGASVCPCGTSCLLEDAPGECVIPL
jgi:hypothetical protein